MKASLLKEKDIEERISSALEKRKENGRYRKLKVLENLIDFRSNDYLGLSSSAWIQQKVSLKNNFPLGATGSRLLSGNSQIFLDIEKFLSEFYNSEEALIFNSGFDANVGLLSTVIRPGDIVFYDTAIHASMHQGLKLSGATIHPFSHNNVAELNELIEKHPSKSPKWIVCESYYSMDGDFAPLEQYIDFSNQFNIKIIVDEAHAVGSFGKNGVGICEKLNISKSIFARVVTFGKALGAHGAAVLSNEKTKEYLINFCKNFIYTTAMAPTQVNHILTAHQFLLNFDFPQKRLFQNIQYFKAKTSPFQNITGEGPIFSFHVPSEKKVKKLEQDLQNKGLAIQAIVAPTVAKGTERLRIILHSFNTQEEINFLIQSLKDFSDEP